MRGKSQPKKMRQMRIGNTLELSKVAERAKVKANPENEEARVCLTESVIGAKSMLTRRGIARCLKERVRARKVRAREKVAKARGRGRPQKDITRTAKEAGPQIGCHSADHQERR